MFQRNQNVRLIIKNLDLLYTRTEDYKAMYFAKKKTVIKTNVLLLQ